MAVLYVVQSQVPLNVLDLLIIRPIWVAVNPYHDILNPNSDLENMQSL